MGKKEEFYTVRGYQIQRRDKKLLTSSMEDYLEMIYREYLKEAHIRMNVLAECLNVQVSSATKIVQKLADLGFIDYQKYEAIKLTGKGIKMGEFLYNRHLAVEMLLKNLGVQKSLLMDTEMIEHNISMETLQNIILFNEYVKDNPIVLHDFEQYKKTYNKVYDFD